MHRKAICVSIILIPLKMLLKFFLNKALKTLNNRNVLNSEYDIEFSKTFKDLGTEIKYYRRRFINNQDSGEAIFIKGPINEPLVLQVTF